MSTYAHCTATSRTERSGAAHKPLDGVFPRKCTSLLLLYIGTDSLDQVRAIRLLLGDQMPKAIASRAAVVAMWFFLCCSISLAQEVSGQKDAATDAVVHPYVRAKDPKWYAKQLVPLRQEVMEIDQQIRAMREARKGGKGTTDAVALDKAPQGVNADADLLLLEQRRTQVLQHIGEIEDEARRNDVVPGAIRAAESTEESGAASAASDDTPNSSPEIAEAKESLRQEKEHLERAKNEASLLQRKLDLDKHAVYSSPEYTVQRSAKTKLTATQNQIAEKQDEIQQAEQRIADLEEHLHDLRLNSLRDSNNGESVASSIKVEEKGETYWRKQFAEIHYKIWMAQSELDILQRELNEALLIYDPNPQKAFRENVTRQNINAHRKAIEDKKKEIAELQSNLSDLEDDLRHAGGDPGWSRE
jgi:DNA repair exonuclease SbcCD ATPase subunit